MIPFIVSCGEVSVLYVNGSGDMVSDGLPVLCQSHQYPAVRPVTPGSSSIGPFGAVVPSMSSINTYVWTALPSARWYV